MNLFRKKSSEAPRRRDSTLQSRRQGSTSSTVDHYLFRRNRTLTGSLASHVASANELQSQLRSPRVQVHDLRRHRKRLMLYLLACLATIGLLGFLVQQSIALPVVVAATDHPIDDKLYQKEIQDYFASRPFERFRFSLNTVALGAYLQTHGCPELASVVPKVSFAGFGRSAIHLDLRRPVVSWQSGDSLVYVDDQGVAFTRNYDVQPSVTVVDQSGLQASNGTKVLASNRFLGFIGRLIGHMKSYQYSVTKVVLPPGTTRQVEVSIEGVAYPLKFSVDRPVGEQAEDAARAMRYVAAQGITPEYLDVRVSGRVYYQ